MTRELRRDSFDRGPSGDCYRRRRRDPAAELPSVDPHLRLIDVTVAGSTCLGVVFRPSVCRGWCRGHRDMTSRRNGGERGATTGDFRNETTHGMTTSTHTVAARGRPRAAPGEACVRLLAHLLLFLLCGSLPAAAQGPPLPRQPYLGADLAPPSPERAGALVRSVTAGTVAEEMGLREGDRILRMNGALMDDPSTFAREHQRLKGGDTLLLTILRDGETLEREAVVPPLPRESLPDVETEYGSALSPRGYWVQTRSSRSRKTPAARSPGSSSSAG